MARLFSQLACLACGRGVDQVALLKVQGGLNHAARACTSCVAKHGMANLAVEADRLLAGSVRAPQGGQAGTCRHCGAPVLSYPNGMMPLWCMACDREAKAALQT